MKPITATAAIIMLAIFVLLTVKFVSANEYTVSDCGPWVNCNYNSPAFDGYCCRICFFEELGYRAWECAEHTYDIGLSEEDKQKIKKRFLYDAVDPSIREMLIVELNAER